MNYMINNIILYFHFYALLQLQKFQNQLSSQ